MPFKYINTFQYAKVIIYRNSDGPILKELDRHCLELDCTKSNEESMKVSE